MKHALGLALFLALGWGCAATEGEPAQTPLPIQHCPEVRPRTCQFETFRPVCAFRESGAWTSHGNPCEACILEAVVGYREGRC